MALTTEQWKEDWRNRGQEQFLKGEKLIYRAYTAPSEEWTHDHCEFCWATFCDDSPRDFCYGYVSELNNYWVCDECFDDLKNVFLWKVEEDTSKT